MPNIGNFFKNLFAKQTTENILIFTFTVLVKISSKESEGVIERSQILEKPRKLVYKMFKNEQKLLVFKVSLLPNVVYL